MSSTPPERQIVPRAELASAAEHRVVQEHSSSEVKRLVKEHEAKQAFRRLIDPGIMRPNNQEIALESLKALRTLSDNLLREPSNEKYQQFKPTNNTIKRRLVDVKGALEYAVALGFRSKVDNSLPIYVFDPHHLEDLRLGNEILKETLDREAAKRASSNHSKETVQEAREAVARAVKLQFHEDRLAKALKDQREAEARTAAAARAATAGPSSPSVTSVSRIPSGGVTLGGHVEPSESTDI